MTFDLDMIRSVYERFPKNVAAARRMTGKNLTLAEKILYTHLWEGDAKQAYNRGVDYVDFAPDRVAMQDATAQMALLQFMQAGKAKAAVPSRGDQQEQRSLQFPRICFGQIRHRILETGRWNHTPSCFGELCFPGWDDDRYRFAHR